MVRVFLGCVHFFDEIFAMVRLAHKYDIQSVEDQGIHALKEYCVTSDFDVYFGSSKPHISMHGAHNIGAANLARLTDTPSMLPLAVYNCCRLGGELLDGWTRRDGTVEHISPEDLKRCVDARGVLGHQKVLLATRLFEAVPQERCKDSGRCAPMVANLARVVRDEQLLMHVHAFWDWSQLIRMRGGMCEGCMEVLYERDKAERRRIWDALPQTLGIKVEGWGESGSDEGAGNAA